MIISYQPGFLLTKGSMILQFPDLINAMFYAAEAILLTKNLKYSSHKGVVSQFGHNFVKTGIFKPELGRDLNRAFDDRSSADYGFHSEITLDMAEKSLTRAQNFIKNLKKYLNEI